jgi:hypothetical protein
MNIFARLALASLLIACGGGSDSPTSEGATDGLLIDPDLEARCQGHCDIAGLGVDDACGPEDRDACLGGCRAAMAGIELMCGACLIDAGEAIYGSGFENQTFCEGGTVASIATDGCGAYCADTAHPGGEAEISARCDAHCDIANLGVDACAADDREACLDRCARGTAGIEFACAACLIDEGESIYATGFENQTFCEGGSLAELSSAACGTFCQ